MELIPGSSPQFTQLLTETSGIDAVSLLQPVLGYFVIVKNDSSATIDSITVRWNAKGYDGLVVSTTGQSWSGAAAFEQAKPL